MKEITSTESEMRIVRLKTGLVVRPSVLMSYAVRPSAATDYIVAQQRQQKRDAKAAANAEFIANKLAHAATIKKAKLDSATESATEAAKTNLKESCSDTKQFYEALASLEPLTAANVALQD